MNPASKVCRGCRQALPFLFEAGGFTLKTVSESCDIESGTEDTLYCSETGGFFLPDYAVWLQTTVFYIIANLCLQGITRYAAEQQVS